MVEIFRGTRASASLKRVAARAMSWYYYLEGNLAFPFKARCVSVRSSSALKKGEEVEVIGMVKEDDCMREMFVLIRFAGRKLGVPLSQLEVINAKGKTREAVEDWRYWAAMGYEFLRLADCGFRLVLRPCKDPISASKS